MEELPQAKLCVWPRPVPEVERCGRSCQAFQEPQTTAASVPEIENGQ